ncbi:hypothetical protein AGMMS49975_15980 [Clostridia bacterium]|nr:hypothetical protein AGMMS49975_15980 [Clostridia bacterium]
MAINADGEPIKYGGVVYPDFGAVLRNIMNGGGGLSSVTHDNTLTGNGSAGSPLGVNISGLIDGNDKILSSSANGFLSSLSLEYDTETGTMTLRGKNGEVLSTINLPLESFLENAEFDNTTNILTFSWNTESGIEDMEVDLSGLIQTYTAGDGLAENDGEFRVVIDGNETRLQIDPTSKSLKIDLTDIKTKLDGIEAEAQVNAATSVADKSGEVTLTKSDIGLGSVDNVADIDKTVKNASYLVADDSELGTWFHGKLSEICHSGTWKFKQIRAAGVFPRFNQGVYAKFQRELP